VKPLQDEIQVLKDRLTKTEKDQVHSKKFEKLTQDQSLRTSQIIDAIQGDIAQLRKENKQGTGAFQELLDDFEKVKVKFEE
jgi:hypothetical protein